MPIGYCGRNRRFSSTNPPVLNNHSNDFKSHLHPHPADPGPRSPAARQESSSSSCTFPSLIDVKKANRGNSLEYVRPCKSKSPTVAAMTIGFVVVQLDVTIVNVALSSNGSSLGGKIAGLQWVVNAFTLIFAALK